MSSTQALRLEVLVLPVADVDRAKAFYGGLGWREDADFFHAGGAARVSGPADGDVSYGSFASFADPDGNVWMLQQITERLPGR